MSKLLSLREKWGQIYLFGTHGTSILSSLPGKKSVPVVCLETLSKKQIPIDTAPSIRRVPLDNLVLRYTAPLESEILSCLRKWM